jgi:hypothetical protein
MRVSITAVQKGDTIIDGRDRIEVSRIEHNACSSKGTHVNRRICYDRTDVVDIRPGKAEANLLDENGLNVIEGEEFNPILDIRNVGKLRVS